MKKILLISGSLHSVPPTLNSPGIPKIIYELAERMKGAHVEVISFFKSDTNNISYDKRKYHQIKKDNLYKILLFLLRFIPYRVKKSIFGTSKNAFLAYYFRMTHLIRKINPEIIITFVHYPSFFWASKACPKAKHIFYYRSSDIVLLGSKAITTLIRKAKGLICLTDESIQKIKNQYGALPFQCKRIQNAVDHQRFNEELRKSFREEDRKAAGLEESDFVIGYAGRIGRSKGLNILLKVIKEIHLDCPKIKLFIAGDQRMEMNPDKAFVAEIKTLLSALPEKIVFFTGWIPNEKILSFYSLLDISVLISIGREGNSMFAIESMASGLPVIATDVGGNSEVVQHGETGFVISPEKIHEELKEKLSMLYKNRAILNEMGAKAYKRTLNNFSYARLEKEFSEFLNKT